MVIERLFHDRAHAARLLAKKLAAMPIENGVVLAIPRGGAPVGCVIAKVLHLPMDLLMSKKIGHPLNPEFAIGSVTIHDVVLDSPAAEIPEDYLVSETRRLQEMLRKRYEYFTRGKAPLELKGKDAIIVDDGLATGNTMLACIKSIRRQTPKSIIVAVPVSSVSAARKINKLADQFVCLETPLGFHAVGQFYEDFSEVSDEVVLGLLTDTNAV